VRISHAVLNRQGGSTRDYLAVHNLGLAFPVPCDSAVAYRFGGSEEVHAGEIVGDQAAYLHQHHADGYAHYVYHATLWENWRMGGAARGTGHTRAPAGLTSPRRPRPRGRRAGLLADVSEDPRGPRARRPRRRPLPRHAVQRADPAAPRDGRTHELTVLFHAGATNEAISDLMAAAQAPLFLVAPASWYCQDTRAFGNLLKADLDLLAPEHRELAAAYERHAREGFLAILARRDSREGLPAEVDEYGFLNYGDGWQSYRDGTAYWCDNYYDFPHALVLQFARTGERDYLDAARAYGRHLGDLDISWLRPAHRGDRRGAHRPSIGHVRSYGDGRSDHLRLLLLPQEREPIGAVVSHWRPALPGDRPARDAGGDDL